MEENAKEELWAYYETPWADEVVIRRAIELMGPEDVQVMQVMQHNHTFKMKMILSLSPRALERVKKWGDAQ